VRNSSSDTLRFVGKTIKGSGCFSKQLHVPGESAIPGLIRDWPEELERGTLNVLIDQNGFPQKFTNTFGSQIGGLDQRQFLPEVELHHSKIGNNTLAPKEGDREDKGNAQIWRAYLTKTESRQTLQCWVLRRIGSNMPFRLECVAGVKIREALNLPEEVNDRVELTIEGEWFRS
jgi:hypothetical protein